MGITKASEHPETVVLASFVTPDDDVKVAVVIAGVIGIDVS